LSTLALLISVGTLSTPLNAQSYFSVSRSGAVGKSVANFGVSETRADYDAGDTTFTYTRRSLGLGLSYEMNGKFRLLANAGYTMAADASFLDRAGTGYLLGGGFGTTVYTNDRLSFDVSSLFSQYHDDFHFNINDRAVQVAVSERQLSIDGTSTFMLTRSFAPYASISGLLFDEGDVQTSSGGVSGSDRFERKDRILMRVGSNFYSGRFGFRPEVTLVGATSYVLAASYRI